MISVKGAVDDGRYHPLGIVVEQRLFEHTLAGAGFAQNQAEAALLGVDAEDVRQENGKGFPTAATLTAIGTKYPLSPYTFFGAVRRVVAIKNAVPVQSLAPLAVRARQLLERKSCA